MTKIPASKLSGGFAPSEADLARSRPSAEKTSGTSRPSSASPPSDTSHALALSRQASEAMAEQRRQRASSGAIGFLPPPLTGVLLAHALQKSGTSGSFQAQRPQENPPPGETLKVGFQNNLSSPPVWGAPKGGFQEALAGGGTLGGGPLQAGGPQVAGAGLPMFAGRGGGGGGQVSEDTLHAHLDALIGGDRPSAEALHEIPPDQFQAADLIEFAEVAKRGGPTHALAFELLGSVALNGSPAETQAKFVEAFHALKGDPAALEALFRGAAFSPTILASLFRQVQGEPGLPLDVIGRMAGQDDPRLRDAAIDHLRSSLPSKGTEAARVALRYLRLPEDDAPDPKGKALAKEAYQTLHSKLESGGRLSAEEMGAVRHFAAEQRRTGTVHLAFPLDLLAQATQQRIPGAREALFGAMDSQETMADAIATLSRAHKDVIRDLVPLAKDLAHNPDAPHFARDTLRMRLAPPYLQSQGQQVEERFQEKLHQALGHAFENDKPGMPLKDLSDRLRAMYILQHSKEIQPHEYDKTRLQSDLKGLMDSPALQRAMDRLRKEAVEEVSQKRGKEIRPQELKTYLLSQDFQHFLALSPSGDRKAIMERQIQLLTALDPKEGVEAAQGLMMRELGDHSLEVLGKADARMREEAVRQAVLERKGGTFESIGRLMHDIQTLGPIPAIQKTLEGLPPASAQEKARETEQITQDVLALLRESAASRKTPQEALHDLRHRLPPDTLQRLRTAERSGELQTILQNSTANLLAAQSGSLEVKDILGIGGSLAKGVGHLPKLQQLLKGGVADDVARRFQGIGAAGQLLSSVSNTLRMMDSIDHRDIVTAALAGTQAAGGAAGAIGGAMKVLGVGARIVPPLMLIGTILSLGGWLAEKIFGNHPDEQFLIDLGYKK